MTEQPVETPADDEPAEDEIVAEPVAAAAKVVIPPVERRLPRTLMYTGFSTVPGKTCAVCGYEGFRWQTECPKGHPLS